MSADEIEGEEWMAEWEEEEEEEGGAEPAVGESSLRMFDSLFLFLFFHISLIVLARCLFYTLMILDWGWRGRGRSCTRRRRMGRTGPLRSSRGPSTPF